MTDLLAWLIANWLIVVQAFALAMVLLISLIVGISFAVSWYFWRLVIELDPEPEPLSNDAIGDVPHVPKELRRDAA